MTTPHIPILRTGREYESLDRNELSGINSDTPLASISQANAGIIRRDLKRIAAKTTALREIPVARMLEICKEAGRHFMESALPLSDDGPRWSPDEYVATLSSTSGLPHVMCRRNMRKIFTVFDGMAGILGGLMRGMDPSIVDTGFGEHCGLPLHYSPATTALGVVLPSNSPGVNSIWMPAIALKIPVVLKPGREEPWTPLRIIRAFIAAGCPPEAFSFYPTDHEGSAAILEHCGRAQLFGDENTTRPYANNPAIELHGPGRSKVLLDSDAAANWRDHLDVLISSVADNGGRSCINASTIVVPSHADEIADALARALADRAPRSAADDDATLSAFANPKFAEWIDASIDAGIADGGAEDVSARHRPTARAQTFEGAQYLAPTVLHCDSIDHPLARTEYLFPFTSVVEVPAEDLVDSLGPSLVVTAITRDPALVDALVQSPHIERLNLGPVPTSHVEWDQPHEGNLFEFLYTRRAIQAADGWHA